MLFLIPNSSEMISGFTDYLFTLTGPVMTKFTIALREIGTYKEVLRSQVKDCDVNVFKVDSCVGTTCTS